MMGLLAIVALVATLAAVRSANAQKVPCTVAHSIRVDEQREFRFQRAGLLQDMLCVFTFQSVAGVPLSVSITELDFGNVGGKNCTCGNVRMFDVTPSGEQRLVVTRCAGEEAGPGPTMRASESVAVVSLSTRNCRSPTLWLMVSALQNISPGDNATTGQINTTPGVTTQPTTVLQRTSSDEAATTPRSPRPEPDLPTQINFSEGSTTAHSNTADSADLSTITVPDSSTKSLPTNTSVQTTLLSVSSSRPNEQSTVNVPDTVGPIVASIGSSTLSIENQTISSTAIITMSPGLESTSQSDSSKSSWEETSNYRFVSTSTTTVTTSLGDLTTTSVENITMNQIGPTKKKLNLSTDPRSIHTMLTTSNPVSETTPFEEGTSISINNSSTTTNSETSSEESPRPERKYSTETTSMGFRESTTQNTIDNTSNYLSTAVTVMINVTDHNVRPGVLPTTQGVRRSSTDMFERTTQDIDKTTIGEIGTATEQTSSTTDFKGGQVLIRTTTEQSLKSPGTSGPSWEHFSLPTTEETSQSTAFQTRTTEKNLFPDTRRPLRPTTNHESTTASVETTTAKKRRWWWPFG